MSTELFPHQVTGANRLANSTPTYLAFDMGLGKTRTFIEAVRASGDMRLLVLCPATALLVWKREIGLWHPGMTVVVVKQASDLSKPAMYYLVSHGLMSQTGSPVAAALKSGAAFDATAIDEAHAFNAPDSNRVKALRACAPKLGMIVPLSGTPMKNHAGDLYTLLQVCWPQGLKSPGGTIMTRSEFEDRFCKVTHRRFGSGPMVRVIEGSKNLDVLRVMIAPFIMRVRKEEVLKDLPPILWDPVPVPLDTSTMSVVDAEAMRVLISEMIAQLSPTGQGSVSNDLVATALSRASNGHLMELRRLLGAAKLRGSTEYIVDMLDTLPSDRKVLVFAHHAHVVAALSRHLGEYSPAVLSGATSPRDREAAVDKFLNDPRCRVFIGNIQAAGTAITLVGPKCKCSDVVFVESSWTPMDNAQAACRVHRIGQRDGVVARMLSAAGTIDDLITGILVRKAREFTQLFDTTGAVKP